MLTGIFSACSPCADDGHGEVAAATAGTIGGAAIPFVGRIVSVAAVVRDRKGRFVTDLSKKDFEIVEAGQSSDILDFRAELNGPVKLAVLMDISGSMRMAQRTAEARRAAEHIFASLSGRRRSGGVLVRHDAERGADVHLRPRRSSKRR